MGILCVFCIYDTIGNGCKHRFQKSNILKIRSRSSKLKQHFIKCTTLHAAFSLNFKVEGSKPCVNLAECMVILFFKTCVIFA